MDKDKDIGLTPRPKRHSTKDKGPNNKKRGRGEINSFTPVSQPLDSPQLMWYSVDGSWH